MTVVLAHGADERCVRIGLVNNMPDPALARTERQFLNLIETAAPDLSVAPSLLSLPGIARSERAQLHLKQNSYRGVWELPRLRLDALIVTGTEPRFPALEDEPYWGPMTELFDWLDREGPPVMLSCLAAHAAVLHFDGIQRRRLPEKRFGIFDHVKVEWSDLTDRLAPSVRVAHSRCNEIAGSGLEKCGYQILTRSPDAGVDLFTRRRRNRWLFFQGHPEYDPGALGREYQRDVRRFLKRERATYPALPKNYFGEAEIGLLTRFRAWAIADRVEGAMKEFPFAACPRSSPDQWQSPAASVFRVWLQQIADLKFSKKPSRGPTRSRWPQPALAFSRS